MSTITDRETQRIRDGLNWSGFLTLANYEAVANRLRAMLTGRSYTWVACNEGLGNYRPEVRAGMRVEKVTAELLSADHGHITVLDTYGVWGLTAVWADQAAARATGTFDQTVRRGPFVEFERGHYGEVFRAEHYALAGYRLCWAVAVEPEAETS